MKFSFLKSQLEKLADLAGDTGLVCLATMVVPPLFDRSSLFTIALGVILTIFFWTLSLLLLNLKI